MNLRLASMKRSELITSPTTCDHVSLVASYHCLKNVKGSAERISPLSILSLVSSTIFSHCVVSSSESLLVSADLFQTSVAASNHCFQTSRGFIMLNGSAFNCS